MDKQAPVPLNVRNFSPEGKTLSCVGHLNWVVLQPTAEAWHLEGHML